MTLLKGSVENLLVEIHILLGQIDSDLDRNVYICTLSQTRKTFLSQTILK